MGLFEPGCQHQVSADTDGLAQQSQRGGVEFGVDEPCVFARLDDAAELLGLLVEEPGQRHRDGVVGSCAGGGLDHHVAGRERPPHQIAAREVTKRFGGLSAVDEVTLEFPPRGVSCLIGPNGAGKSTLLNLLSGQSRVTSGSVTLDGPDLTTWPPYRRARSGISIKLQVASIYAELTARENLWLACYAMPRDVAAADKRAEELLEWLLLRDHADSPAGTLSHGQKQWLEIGMVVAANPVERRPRDRHLPGRTH